MGGSRNQTSTTTSDPWKGQQPYLTDLFQQGQSLFQQGPQQYYPGQTVAPFSPQTQMGMDLMTQRALGGSPQQDAFGQYLQGQLGQQNLDPNSIYGPAMQAAGGIGQGQNLMNQAGQAAFGMGQPNGMVGSAAGALGGSLGYGGLGEAGRYAGTPAMGALPASQQYVQDTLAASPSFGDFASQIQQFAPGGFERANAERLAQQFGASQAATGQLAGTAGGQFLGSNPYLDQMFNKAAGRAGEAFNEQTMPALAAQFGSAGRTGSGLHQQMGENAARQFGRDLQGMAADIYAPAYESERGRQIQAAGALGGLDLQGQGLGLQQGQSNQSAALQAALANQAAGLQGQGLNMQGLNLAGNLYGGEQQRRLGAAGLGGDLFSAYNQADLGRLGLGSDLYLGDRGLGQQAAQALGQLGLGQGNLGLGGLNTALGAGQGLGQLGIGGLGAMGDLYGNIAQNQFRAGSLMPSYNDMQYGDIQRLMGVGGMVEDQAQRMMGANQDRWNFGQNAPWQNLQNYANVIYGLPGGYGTQTATQPGGSRLQGALGGAMSGAALGPWGMLGGAVLGGLL